ncbi:MAG: hypothetical protein LBO09_01485 [Candidatus Peribacteria bacterium]|nr:hypothetical protein [Candidatus Peribacteria bacterium]
MSVVLTLNESGTVVGRTKVNATTYTKTYPANTTETVSFFDLVGNT